MDIKRLQDAIKSIKQAYILDVGEVKIRKSIDLIRDKFVQEWEAEYHKEAQELFDVLQSGFPTPTLAVCGLGGNEIRYTSYLAYYLNPQNQHGLGALPLRRLFGSYVPELDEADMDTVTVDDGIWLGEVLVGSKAIGCDCDIGIRFKDVLILVENKRASGQHSDKETGMKQLTRYDAALRNHPTLSKKKVYKFFLTPSGKKASNAPEWQPISYGELVEKLKEIAFDGNLPDAARENLRRFLLDLCFEPNDEHGSVMQEIYDAVGEAVKNYNVGAVYRYQKVLKQRALLIEIIKGG